MSRFVPPPLFSRRRRRRRRRRRVRPDLRQGATDVTNFTRLVTEANSPGRGTRWRSKRETRGAASFSNRIDRISLISIDPIGITRSAYTIACLPRSRVISIDSLTSYRSTLRSRKISWGGEIYDHARIWRVYRHEEYFKVLLIILLRYKYVMYFVLNFKISII